MSPGKARQACSGAWQQTSKPPQRPTRQDAAHVAEPGEEALQQPRSPTGVNLGSGGRGRWGGRACAGSYIGALKGGFTDPRCTLRA
jgi:hypothetical protein